MNSVWEIIVLGAVMHEYSLLFVTCRVVCDGQDVILHQWNTKIEI